MTENKKYYYEVIKALSRANGDVKVLVGPLENIHECVPENDSEAFDVKYTHAQVVNNVAQLYFTADEILETDKLI